jgi:hypothetical protein
MLRESPEHLAELLKALPPSMRGEIFTGAYEGINIENMNGLIICLKFYHVKFATEKQKEWSISRKSGKIII